LLAVRAPQSNTSCSITGSGYCWPYLLYWATRLPAHHDLNFFFCARRKSAWRPSDHHSVLLWPSGVVALGTRGGDWAAQARGWRDHSAIPMGRPTEPGTTSVWTYRPHTARRWRVLYSVSTQYGKKKNAADRRKKKTKRKPNDSTVGDTVCQQATSTSTT